MRFILAILTFGPNLPVNLHSRLLQSLDKKAGLKNINPAFVNVFFLESIQSYLIMLSGHNCIRPVKRRDTLRFVNSNRVWAFSGLVAGYREQHAFLAIFDPTETEAAAAVIPSRARIRH